MALNRRQFLIGAGGWPLRPPRWGWRLAPLARRAVVLRVAAAEGADQPGSGLLGQPDAQQEHPGRDRRVHEGQPRREDRGPAG